MKRILGAILLALILTLAMAVPVMAATTEVTGDVVMEDYIDVTAPSAFSLSDMQRGKTTTVKSSEDLIVKTNITGYWFVKAQDLTNGGYMISGETPLKNKFQIAKAPGTANLFDADASPPLTYRYDDGSFPFYVSQKVELDDVIAVGYSITITFTGYW